MKLTPKAEFEGQIVEVTDEAKNEDDADILCPECGSMFVTFYADGRHSTVCAVCAEKDAAPLMELKCITTICRYVMPGTGLAAELIHVNDSDRCSVRYFKHLRCIDSKVFHSQWEAVNAIEQWIGVDECSR